MKTWLIGYDISDPRRLSRLHRRLKRFGTPIQYSLFLCTLTKAQQRDCVAMIKQIIDPRADDVRLYPLPENGWCRRIGRATLPAGIWHTGLPEQFIGTGEEESGAESEYDASQNARPHQKPGTEPCTRDKTVRRWIAGCQTGQTKGILYIR